MYSTTSASDGNTAVVACGVCGVCVVCVCVVCGVCVWGAVVVVRTRC